MKLLTVFCFSVLSFNVFAQELFILKKSFNPRNILHFTATVEKCALKGVRNHWIMGEQGGGTEGLSSSERPYFEPKITYKKDSELDFTMGAIQKLGNKIEDNSIRVRLVKCQPKAYITLNRQEVQLTEIYASVGFLMSVNSLTITGIAPNGLKVSKKIDN